MLKCLLKIEICMCFLLLHKMVDRKWGETCRKNLWRQFQCRAPKQAHMATHAVWTELNTVRHAYLNMEPCSCVDARSVDWGSQERRAPWLWSVTRVTRLILAYMLPRAWTWTSFSVALRWVEPHVHPFFSRTICKTVSYRTVFLCSSLIHVPRKANQDTLPCKYCAIISRNAAVVRQPIWTRWQQMGTFGWCSASTVCANFSICGTWPWPRVVNQSGCRSWNSKSSSEAVDFPLDQEQQNDSSGWSIAALNENLRVVERYSLSYRNHFSAPEILETLSFAATVVCTVRFSQQVSASFRMNNISEKIIYWFSPYLNKRCGKQNASVPWFSMCAGSASPANSQLKR